MKLLEIIIGIAILVLVFSFGSTIFMNSSENIDTFGNFLINHTENISEISKLGLNTGNCIEKNFTGFFLFINLTGYFCDSGERIFSWQLK